MTKLELLALIADNKQKAKEDYLEKRFNSDYLTSLRSLLNGVFTAEGSWSGQFYARTSHRFTPKFSIGQNAGSESIKLFSLMWVILDCQLVWQVSRTKNNNFHIQLVNTNFDYIISTLIPYFSLTFGEKFTAGAKLLRLAELKTQDTLLARFETICLVYSLTSGGHNRIISLKDKLIACGVYEDKLDITQSKISALVESRNKNNQKLYPENTLPLNILFILGFFLGDGSLYIRIRDKKNGLTFIPKFEIKQKNIFSSVQLLQKICEFFLSSGIQATLQENDNYVLCVIEGIENVCQKLLPFLIKHSEFFFWKEYQLDMTNQFGKLISLDTRNLLPVKYLLIKTIYSIDNDRNYPFGHWINRINEIFKNKSANISGEFYISQKKSKTEVVGWNVYLPEFFNVKPRTKYFYFSTFGGKIEALRAAVHWRDNIINSWLHEQGYETNPVLSENSEDLEENN